MGQREFNEGQLANSNSELGETEPLFTAEETEDQQILKLTKNSAWLLLAISVLLATDYFLPDSVVDEQAVEFIHAGNALEKVVTESTSFRPMKIHSHAEYFAGGPIRISQRPITGFVSSYQTHLDEYQFRYRPHFCQDSWISLVYVTMILSLAQLLAPLSLFSRMTAWLFSLGSMVGYFIMVIAFS